MPFEMDSTISIHAPCEGGDSCRPSFFNILAQISIHAPRKGGDFMLSSMSFFTDLFQSTPPARGATAKMHSFTCGSLTNK